MDDSTTSDLQNTVNGAVGDIAAQSIPNMHELVFYGGILLAVTFIILSTAAALIANFARRKGRTWVPFYWVSLWSFVIGGTIVATIAETTHSDEAVVCPACASKIPHQCSVCSHCGQKLSPNAAIGLNVVNRALEATKRIKLVAPFATGLGVILVALAMIQSEADLMKNLYVSLAAWVVLGAGISLFTMLPIRKLMTNELYNVLVGK